MAVDIIFSQVSTSILYWKWQELAIGAIDGVNKAYAITYPMQNNSLEIFINGIKCESNTYTIVDSKTFTLNTALTPSIYNRIETVYQTLANNIL